MSKLLHISASPRGQHSESLALGEAFLSAFQATRPEVPVETWDLWDGTLPSFGPAAANAKMAVFAGADPQGAEAAAWHAARATLEQFIDVVSQPGMVFGFDGEAGYTGLLRGKKAAVIYTSAVYGPSRGPAFGSDFQAPYFDDWLRWAGINDIVDVRF